MIINPVVAVKKTVIKFFIPLLPVLFVLFAGCKKSAGGITVTLYNKPLSVIQANTQGAWKMEYEQGGECGGCVNDVFRNQRYIWEFTTDGHLKITLNDTLIENDPIVWVKAYDYWHEDSTYIVSYSTSGPGWGIDGIYDDTLVMHDVNVTDAMSYHLSRYKKP